MEMLIEYLMRAVGMALAALIVFVVKQYLIPWFKVKIGNEKYTELRTVVLDLMAAAEQKFGPKTGAEKKQFVLDELKKLGIAFDEEYVGALIDGFTSVLTAEGIINTNK